MINVIRADLYRLVRSKGLYITIGLFIILIGLQVATGTIGRVVSVGGMTIHEIPNAENKFTGIVAIFKMIEVTDTVLYFVLPFIIFIGSADFSFGTAKNVLSNGMSRNKYYLSKLILSCAFCFLLVTLNIIAPLVAGTIINGFGGAFTLSLLGSILRPVFAQLFFCLSVTCIGVFFVFVTRRTAAVNGAYIAFCIVPLLLISILIQLNENLVFLLDYDILTIIRKMASIDHIDLTSIVRSLAVGGFYIIASTIGGMAIFRRIEIK